MRSRITVSHRRPTVVRRTPGTTKLANQAEDGFVMSSSVALMGAAAVLIAGVTYATTEPASVPREVASVTPVAAALPIEEQVTIRALRIERVVERKEIYVTVFNNSTVTGLASSTSARITSAGWQVVGSDNWYGTIPATTVYYPPKLGDAAKMLAKDLGIARVLPAVEPMLMDRLTVILTADFA